MDSSTTSAGFIDDTSTALLSPNDVITYHSSTNPYPSSPSLSSPPPPRCSLIDSASSWSNRESGFHETPPDLLGSTSSPPYPVGHIPPPPPPPPPSDTHPTSSSSNSASATHIYRDTEMTGRHDDVIIKPNVTTSCHQPRDSGIDTTVTTVLNKHICSGAGSYRHRPGPFWRIGGGPGGPGTLCSSTPGSFDRPSSYSRRPSSSSRRTTSINDDDSSIASNVNTLSRYSFADEPNHSLISPPPPPPSYSTAICRSPGKCMGSVRSSRRSGGGREVDTGQDAPLSSPSVREDGGARKPLLRRKTTSAAGGVRPDRRVHRTPTVAGLGSGEVGGEEKVREDVGEVGGRRRRCDSFPALRRSTPLVPVPGDFSVTDTTASRRGRTASFYVAPLRGKSPGPMEILSGLRRRFSRKGRGARPQVDDGVKRDPYERVRINVSGQSFETYAVLLGRHPDTLLGDPRKRRLYFDHARGEVFFDRHRPSFEAIFSYFQYGGRIRRPHHVPDDVFLRELLFYELEKEAVDAYKLAEGYSSEEIQLPTNESLKRLWMLFEYPETSRLELLVRRFHRTVPVKKFGEYARVSYLSYLLTLSNLTVQSFVIALVSLVMTLTSIVLFCVETLPMFSQSHCEHDTAPNFLDPFFIIETTCTIWFTVEAIVRFISCPSKLLFWKDFKNIVDVTAVIPYYVTFFNVISTMSCASAKSSASLAFLRVIRLVRVFKLTKHSVGLQVLILTFKASLEGLCLFLVALVVCLLVFSSAIYYAELDVPSTQITSIPAAFWWAIITMTTVGYGDMVPVGPLGKLIGTICALTGVLTLAIPVPIITGHFNRFYSHRTGRGRITQ